MMLVLWTHVFCTQSYSQYPTYFLAPSSRDCLCPLQTHGRNSHFSTQKTSTLQNTCHVITICFKKKKNIVSSFLACWVFFTTLQMPSLFLKYNAPKNHTSPPTQVGSKIWLESNICLITLKNNLNSFFHNKFHSIEIRSLSNFQFPDLFCSSEEPFTPCLHHKKTLKIFQRKTYSAF